MRILVLDAADTRARTLARSLAAALDLPLLETDDPAAAAPQLEVDGADAGFVLLARPATEESAAALDLRLDGRGTAPELVFTLAPGHSGLAQRLIDPNLGEPRAATHFSRSGRLRRLRPEGTDAQLLAAARRILEDWRAARTADREDLFTAILRHTRRHPEAPHPPAQDHPEIPLPPTAADQGASAEAQSATQGWKQTAVRKGRLVRARGRRGPAAGGKAHRRRPFKP
jgi:hypothetical protein